MVQHDKNNRRRRPSERAVRRSEALDRTPTALPLGATLFVIGVIVISNDGNALIAVVGFVLLCVGLIQRTIIQASQARSAPERDDSARDED